MVEEILLAESVDKIDSSIDQLTLLTQKNPYESELISKTNTIGNKSIDSETFSEATDTSPYFTKQTRYLPVTTEIDSVSKEKTQQATKPLFPASQNINLWTVYYNTLYRPTEELITNKVEARIKKSEEYFEKNAKYIDLANRVLDKNKDKESDSIDFSQIPEACELLDMAAEDHLVEKGKYKFTKNELEVLTHKVNREQEKLSQLANKETNYIAPLFNMLVQILAMGTETQRDNKRHMEVISRNWVPGR
jgi:hypothetical protein